MTSPILDHGRLVGRPPAGMQEPDLYAYLDALEQPDGIERFHLQGQHNQKDHGRRYGRTRALSEPDGGMTLDTEHLQPMTTGWAVAIKATDRLLLASTAFDTDGNPSKQLVRLVRDRLEAARTSTPVQGTRLALGGWHNPADGKIEINVTVVFPKTEQERARQFAVDNDQISMANLDAITAGDWDHAIVDTGGTGGDRRTEDELAVRRRRFRLSQGVIQ